MTVSFLPLTHLGLLPRYAIWLASFAIVIILGVIRSATDAEYAFSSFALLFVVLVTWVNGRNSGLLLSVIAAVIWGIADVTSIRHFSSEWIPLVNSITRAATDICIVFIISVLKSSLIQVENMATHDQLTGLFNRRAFINFGKEEVERSRRYGHHLAVVFLDLDNFKKINDSRGHLVGDMVLKKVAVALENTLRASDMTVSAP